MLTKYIAAAMHRATYSILEDDETYLGNIPDCQGVWANEDTLESCREELESVLGDWILARVSDHLLLPVIDGIDLNVHEQHSCCLMPPFGSIKRRKLIGYLQMLRFSKPISRGKHQHMKKGDITPTIPNPHQGDISKDLLSRILREAGISREEWELI